MNGYLPVPGSQTVFPVQWSRDKGLTVPKRHLSRSSIPASHYLRLSHLSFTLKTVPSQLHTADCPIPASRVMRPMLT
ncbi:hypothetical protein BaRGS_00006336 [Batillaria attramentaria]|uniref:Uncharacterized protein n=1 Tax=Batillaria attramentaria TaxID=370345 RepID=A0ABD0LTD2_9CAEN